MSFGFGAGDFVTALQLAKAAYSACRDGPGEYQEIAREAKSLRYALTQLSKDCDDPSSLINRKGTTGRRQEFRNMITNCEAVFVDLQQLVDKHSVLEPGTEHGNPVRRLWHAYQVGSEDLESLRGQLTFHTSIIAMFQNSLSGSAISRIEAKLENLCEMMFVESSAKAGISTLSLASTASFLSQLESDEKVAWKILRDELLSEDISIAAIMANKDEILLYMKNLVKSELEPTQSLPRAVDLSDLNARFLNRLFSMKQAGPLGLIKVNRSCPLSRDHCWATAIRLRYLKYMLPRPDKPEGKIEIASYVTITRRNEARTLKDHLCDVNNLRARWELLEEYHGLQVSICTGLASAVPLQTLLADTNPTLANGVVEYVRLSKDPAFLQALQTGSLLEWAGGAETPRETKELVTEYIRKVLVLLQTTGIDKSAGCFRLYWPYPEKGPYFLEIPCKKSDPRMRMLTDTMSGATFAYMTKSCLETDSHKCRAHEAKYWWEAK